MEYNDEEALKPGAAGPLDAATFLVDKRPHSTPVVSEKMETSRSDASQVPVMPLVRCLN